MKRATQLLVLAAAASVLVAPTAGAAAKSKTVTRTYYLHGSSALGNQDNNPLTGDPVLPMDAKKPTGTSDKRFVQEWIGEDCAGFFGFPAWSGAASGNLVGTVTVLFYAHGGPSEQAKVSLFGDLSGQVCSSNGDYESMGSVLVTVPAGSSPQLVKAVVPVEGKGKVASSFAVQIEPAELGGVFGPQPFVVAYDSTTSPSSVTFRCKPKAGKKAC